MTREITFGVLLMILTLARINAQVLVEGDTIPYKIITEGPSHYQQQEVIVLHSEIEYFEFHYRCFGSYPRSLQFDFTKGMIVVFFRTLSSGSYHLSIDHVIETPDAIAISTIVEGPEYHSQDIKPVYMILAVKKSDKLVVVN